MKQLTVAEILGPQGHLARVIGAAYAPRPAQLQFALAVQRALDAGQTLVAELGTGTGKSWGYLAGGLAAGARIVVSTSSKALQGQLLNKDLPLLAQAVALRYAVAKGKANYLCLLKSKPRNLFGEEVWPAEVDAAALSQWANSTQTGDLDEVPHALPATARDQIAAGDDCLGTHCQRYHDCWYYRAKAQWPGADVLVVNHALLLLELQRPVGVLVHEDRRPLALVCDEAHQLENYAVNALSAELTPRALRYAERLDAHLVGLSAEFWRALARYARPGEDVALDPSLELQAGYDLSVTLRDLADDYYPHSAPPKNASAMPDYLVATRLRSLGERAKALAAPTKSGFVRHIQHMAHWHGSLEATLLAANTAYEVGGFLAGLRAQPTATIYTSATLATAPGVEGLRYSARTLGLNEYASLVLDSPFRYDQQGLLYLPPTGALPDVNTPQYTAALGREILALLTYTHGRALCLFTAYTALRQVADLLRAYRSDLTLLEQGADLTRDALLAQFRAHNGRGQVLLGTRSFWEGISLEGEQLSLVVIDRLPFTPPSPVQRAKQAELEAHGGNWFMHLALPEAIAALRQGVGRLIRTTTDRGVVALLDPRLTSKAWGRQVLNALPRFRVTRQRNDVAVFLRTGGRP